MERVLEGISICIDSGHFGKYNRSPGIAEYYESEVMWRLSQMQKNYLELFGAKVKMTRTDPNKDKGLQARGAASEGCDLFISNHSNAVGNYMNESIDYVAVYHLVNDAKIKADDISREIAQELAPVIAQAMGTKQSPRVLSRKSSSDRNKDGILNDNYYGVLHGAYMVGTPATILEHSFHTNSEIVRWLLKDANLDRLARLEAECIASYFAGREVKITSGVVAEPSDSLNESFLIKVSGVSSGDVLNIRKGPNARAKITGTLAWNDPNKYTIVEVENGWGKLKSGIGWINLRYTKRV